MMRDFDSAHWTALQIGFTLKSIISSIGIVTNSVLLIATYRSSNLKSKCNFLIGACALFDVFHLLGTYSGFTVFTGDGLMDSITCCVLQFLPEIGLYAGCFCVLSIGIDRLLSVSLPAIYRNVKRKTYLAVHLAAIFLFSSYAPYLMIEYYVPDRVICSQPDTFHGEGQLLWMQGMLAVNVLTLIPYALTWMNLRSRDSSSYTKRVFRAIALVMIFDVGGWLLAVAMVTVVYTVDISDQNRLILQYVCGCIVFLGITIKPVIYYTTSTEYRNAFRQLFGFTDYVTANSQSVLMPGKKTNGEQLELTSNYERTSG